MCPAPLYSYFDAQLLADFIMTSQFQEFDTQNSATSGNANQHYDQLSVAATAASLASGYSDYETQDNARLRKRRMTVTDDRRNSLYDYSGSRDAGLFGMNDGYQAGYGQSLAHSSSLPVPPGEGQSIADAITEGMSLSDLAFAGSQQYQVGEMSAGSGGHDGRPQSLRVAVTRAQNTE
ncbi:hypothetical protein FBU59_001551 [Linderina macrospora]|uniref:Uncharacterized protein n=1 Tax=Linderina macrospora TaxID=4868 RepID=A0ACC1JDQ6_9FUNG|nr:hypothetical protein FBU59_001551 [Linderina macrospora]